MASTKASGLTEARIRDFKPETTTRIFWDHTVRGLGVRVTPAGSKSFVVQYRIAGRSRRSTVAQCSAIPLKRAREIAGEQLAAIRNHGDDPLQRRQDAVAAPTVSDGLDRFFREDGPRRVADGRMRPRTLADYGMQAERYVRPAIGALKIADVRRGDVEKMLAGVGGSGVHRNRVQALASRLFTSFERWEWRAPQTNPVRLIEKVRETPRTRTFSPSELAKMGAAINGLSCPSHKAALRFLILTGWRVGEILGLEWSWIDFETGVVNLPSTKVGPARRTADVLALQSLDALARTTARVFAPATYGTIRSWFGKVCTAAGIEGARLHDIRRTVATSAAGSGLSVLLLRDLLGHQTTAMASRYAQQSNTALQAAQQAAAGRMAALLAGDSAEVIGITEGAAARRKQGIGETP